MLGHAPLREIAHETDLRGVNSVAVHCVRDDQYTLRCAVGIEPHQLRQRESRCKAVRHSSFRREGVGDGVGKSGGRTRYREATEQRAFLEASPYAEIPRV